MAIGAERRARRRLQHERFPDAGGNAPADELLAILHRTGRVAALLPAEALGALAIGRHQRLAGVRLVMQLILVGVVADAKFKRIDIGFVGEFVDRDLEQVHAGGGPRRAHVSRRRNVDRGDGMVEFGVLAGDRRYRPSRATSRYETRSARSPTSRVDHRRCKLALLVRGERHRVAGIPGDEHA